MLQEPPSSTTGARQVAVDALRPITYDLTEEELRVLGCLVEKEAFTPDNYPLSSNALVNACNQTSSRDPIVSYTERDIDAVMLSLHERGLARTVRSEGQRVNKQRHVAHEAWALTRPQLALLSVLMLRGAQTLNELRVRSERYNTGLDGAGTEAELQGMAARDEPLVRRVGRRPGEREDRWVHLLGGEAAALVASERTVGGDVESSARTESAGTARGGVPAGTAAERIATLETQVLGLQQSVDALQRQLESLHAALGIVPEPE